MIPTSTAASPVDDVVAPAAVAAVLRLVGRLRRAGIAVSTGEVIDAVAAVASIDVESRSQVRLALRATLIKDGARFRDFDRAFETVDVLLSPTSPTTAFRFGAHSEDPLAMYLADLLTIPANLAGLPAISLPCGFDDQGLPIGLQLITGVLEEPRLLQVAHQYEQAARVMASRPAAALVP